MPLGTRDFASGSHAASGLGYIRARLLFGACRTCTHGSCSGPLAPLLPLPSVGALVAPLRRRFQSIHEYACQLWPTAYLQAGMLACWRALIEEHGSPMEPTGARGRASLLFFAWPGNRASKAGRVATPAHRTGELLCTV